MDVQGAPGVSRPCHGRARCTGGRQTAMHPSPRQHLPPVPLLRQRRRRLVRPLAAQLEPGAAGAGDLSGGGHHGAGEWGAAGLAAGGAPAGGWVGACRVQGEGSWPFSGPPGAFRCCSLRASLALLSPTRRPPITAAAAAACPPAGPPQMSGPICVFSARFLLSWQDLRGCWPFVALSIAGCAAPALLASMIRSGAGAGRARFQEGGSSMLPACLLARLPGSMLAEGAPTGPAAGPPPAAASRRRGC